MDFPDPGACVVCGGDGEEPDAGITHICNECDGTGRRRITPNGYDQRWVDAINEALNDRETDVRAVDIDDAIWDKHLHPLVDAFDGPAIRADLVVHTSLEGRAWNLIHKLAAQTTRPFGLGTSDRERDLAQLAHEAQNLLDS